MSEVSRVSPPRTRSEHPQVWRPDPWLHPIEEHAAAVGREPDALIIAGRADLSGSGPTTIAPREPSHVGM